MLGSIPLNDEERENLRRQQQQAAKERLLRERGVLIPPAFGFSINESNNNGHLSSSYLSPSVQDSHASISFYPSPWQRLCRRDNSSYGLLHDYMQPGVWAKTGDGDAGNVSVLASILTSSNGSSSGDDSAPAVLGRIVGERYWLDRRIMTCVRGGTTTTTGTGNGNDDDDDGATSLTTKVEFLPGLSIWASGNMNGQGWLSSNLNYTYNNSYNNSDLSSSPSSTTGSGTSSSSTTASGADDDVNLELISWIPFNNNNKSRGGNVLGDLHTFGALRVARFTAAAQAQVSLDDALDVSNVQTYCSMDLLGSLSPKGSSPPPPPLQLTLERSSPTCSALCLSQVVSFDRHQFNPWEDRAPFVRNTAAWTIRLENNVVDPNNPNSNLDAFSTMTDDDMTDTMPATATSTTDIVVGTAWQMNRAVAIKTVIRPIQQSITGALLLKRWKQPRLTCSLLGSYSWRTGHASFLGVGLELETMSTTTSSNNNRSGKDDHYYYPAGTRPTGMEAPPETKATLPDGK